MMYYILYNIIYIKKESSKCSLKYVVLCDSDISKMILKFFEAERFGFQVVGLWWESPTAQVALPQGVSFDAEQQRYTVGDSLNGEPMGNLSRFLGWWLIDVLNVFVIYWYVTLDIIATYCKIYVLRADISLGKSAKNSQVSTCKKQHTVY